MMRGGRRADNGKGVKRNAFPARQATPISSSHRTNAPLLRPKSSSTLVEQYSIIKLTWRMSSGEYDMRRRKARNMRRSHEIQFARPTVLRAASKGGKRQNSTQIASFGIHVT
ncbi:unnamed protein product [Caenorhabditis auriculariae]|uniref:Uncharacterized protein n=1 Tax=Caenorhabditis auriculariae TaxID=2777116 RepID=A0A8S1GR27_9PELO|nr:unnamed protein product [Caenorhabditis auriculariae]